MTICDNDGCTKKASFNVHGEKAKYCATHKGADMIDVRNPKCFCQKSQPRWNFAGLPSNFCGECKSDGMVEKNRKLCACGTRPTFNFENLKALFCIKCKTEGMINVGDKRCVCNKLTSPCYNFEGLKGKYCSSCKLPGMIDVKNPTCECGISRPNFNYEGLKPKFCSKCKLVDMVDVLHGKCKCGKNQAHFNFTELKPEYCSLCKLVGMIDVRHNLCICGKAQPTYNLEGLSAKYCVSCKNSDMVDVRHPRCKTYLCDIRPQDKFEGYCLRCFVNTFPDKPVTRNYKTKEGAVVEYIKSELGNYSWVTDKTVEYGCSKRRPDLLLDLGYQIVIVEIDENQHKKYDCICDNKRLMTLSQDLGHRPIVFIRFNPDDYVNQTGDKIKSCWTITKQTGMIKIGTKKEWANRLVSLKAQIEYWINPDNKTDKLIEIIQLYYDQNL